MNNSEFSVGREIYGFLKCRYYIKINNVKDYYYYSKSMFVKRAFDLVLDDINEQRKLEDLLNKLI